MDLYDILMGKEEELFTKSRNIDDLNSLINALNQIVGEVKQFNDEEYDKAEYDLNDLIIAISDAITVYSAAMFKMKMKDNPKSISEIWREANK